MHTNKTLAGYKIHMAQYLASKGLDPIRPFCCLNPAHDDKKPSMRFDPMRNKVHCFSCGADYDVIDLVGIEHGLAGKELFKKMDTLFKQPKKHQPRKKNDYAPREIFSLQVDYGAYFALCRSRIRETTYARERGLSDATLERFGIGYDPAWKHPKLTDNSRVAPSPRLIIPTGPQSYTARAAQRDITEKARPYAKMKVGPVRIFNASVLETAKQPVFVVEAEMDALSVVEAGGEAVSLGGTANVKAFLAMLARNRPAQMLILALDNDEAGQKASKTLEKGLQDLEILFYRSNIAGEQKDPSEALERDRQAFIARVLTAAAWDGGREAYLRTSAVSRLEAFFTESAEGVHTPAVKTGFFSLDTALDGGLREGLYVMGAMSGLGKTTFALQLMDQVAQNGHDALFFSLEMARDELIAKSLSRHTMREAIRLGDGRLARTTREILDADRRWSREGRQVILPAITAYREYAGRLFLLECAGKTTTADVREAVRSHISFTGRRPVVFIDYLQLLSPWSERMTDKQNMDRSVMELKRTSRDHKTAVVAVSSMNRSGYGEAVKMEGFKESGGIEYSADVLFGIQYAGMGGKNFSAAEAQKKIPREIELIVLKNRNGPAGNTIPFKYYAAHNYFAEAGL